MRALKSIEIGSRTVIVHELTVGEIRVWLREAESSVVGDPIGALLFERCTLADLRRLSNLTEEDVAALAPSELREVIEAAEEVNSDFFAMRARLADVGRRLSETGVSPSKEPSPA